MPPRSLSSPRKQEIPAWISRLARGCPPALLRTADFLAAHPDKASIILGEEIRRRREQLLLLRQTRSFIWWRFGDALQGFLVMSTLILSLLWTFRGLARLREWLESLDPRFLPGGQDVYRQVQTLINASPFGAWPWQIPTLLVVLLVVGLFTRHLGIMLFSWRDLVPLRASRQALEQEVAILETWQTFAQEQTTRE